jgi:hypothetical protein
MKKSLSLLLLFLWLVAPTFLCATAFPQSVKLEANFDRQSSTIELKWNMINHGGRTGYSLIKSEDGKMWSEVAKDQMPRNYSQKDIYTYNDRLFNSGNKTWYRVRIFDEDNNTVVLSPIVTVVPKEASLVPASSIAPVSSWAIYPNPVSDVLNLACKGNERVKGVINVTVTDMTGKPVKKFRGASTNRAVQIPVENLKRGVYVAVVTIEERVVMSERFVKE